MASEIHTAGVKTGFKSNPRAIGLAKRSTEIPLSRNTPSKPNRGYKSNPWLKLIHFQAIGTSSKIRCKIKKE